MNNSDDSSKKVEEVLTDFIYKNPHRSKRNGSIYERFISRIQNTNGAVTASAHTANDNSVIDSDQNDSANVKKYSSYELFNEDELQVFVDSKQQASATNMLSNREAASAALYTSHKPLFDYTVDNNSHLISSPNTEKSKSRWGKCVDASKIRVIRLFCGLLLSAVMVIILNATGILSDLTYTTKEVELAANNAQTTSVKSSAVVAVEEPKNSNIASNRLDKTTAKSTTLEKYIPSTQMLEKQNGRSDKTNNIDTKTTISIEDFKEEAENTLYREETEN